MPTPQQALKQYFGFDRFREGQEETVQRVLDGQHTLLVMPTGSGKSLTYQLPALLQPGLTLVLSPLIALMKDQVDGLVEAELPATYINSSLPGNEVNRRIRAMQEGEVKLLYIAPERLRNRRFTRALANTKVSLLAVDEAHCISQWGHDFRPDYLQIGPTWQAMGQPTLLATTATATPQVQQDIVNILGMKNIQTTVTGFNRPNLTFRVIYAPDERTKLQTLQAHLKKVEGSAIVYAATRKNTDTVADFINDVLRIPAGAYHAGLDRDTRHRVQTDFMADRIKIVVATNAFGMGVDKPDVRAVIHYNMPANVEAYYQEAGRAGRDNQPATCIILYAPDDQRLQEWMINSDTPTLDDLHQIYTRLAQAANEDEVYFSPNELAEMTGLHHVKIRVTLNELEQAGAIYHLGSEGHYGHWKVMSLANDAFRERAMAINSRAKIRRNLLGAILNYVNLTSCRRKFLLGYFGDIHPPEAANCCDNHTTKTIEDFPKAVTPQDWFPLIVLETVRTFQARPIGRNRLAQLLNGSRAKGIAQFGYNQHKFYGKLNALSQPQIVTLIDTLIAGRYLRLSGGELPVLVLTESGFKVLEARVALPIIPPGLSALNNTDDVDRWKKRSERSDTTMETLNLFQQGFSPAQIAARRDLVEGTIYTHLARLIGNKQIDLYDVISLEIETQVLEAVKNIGDAGRLAPLNAILPDNISYGHIKCVLAVHPELPQENSIPDTAQSPEQRIVALGESNAPEHIPELTPHLQSLNSSTPLSPQPSNPTAIIINAVAKLGGTLGRTGLSQFLNGSKANWLDTFANHSAYGQLSSLSQKAILNIIDALITDGQLVITSGGRPKINLPNQSPESISQPQPPANIPVNPQPSADESISISKASSPDSSPNPHLLDTLRIWRTEQAGTQSVPPYIIFSNKVLDVIAAQQPTTLKELQQISGIGPAKLEQYGQAVIDLVFAQESTQTNNTPAPNKEEPQHQKPHPAPTLEHHEKPAPPNPKSKVQNPKSQEVIIATVSDLDGLLTIESLAQLLTAGPEEIVSFSDHQCFGLFHNRLTGDIISSQIQDMIQSKHLALSVHKRLILP